MRGSVRVERPKNVEVTISLTATVDEWYSLRDQLVRKWPSSGLSNLISDGCYKMSASIGLEGEEGGEL
jgi:hypothetical protein